MASVRNGDLFLWGLDHDSFPWWGLTQPHAFAAAMSLMELKKKFWRNTSSGECVLSGEGGCFTIELATTREQIAEAYELLCMKLSAAEVEPLERLVQNAMGIVLAGRKTGYRLFIARDQQGAVAATYGGSLMGLSGNDAVFIGTYAATHDSYAGKGLMGQLFISGLIQAAEDAHNLKEELVLIIGDCTPTSEWTWDSVGRKRVCLVEGDSFREVGFYQPAIKFDLSTGLPAEGMSAIKEHLMVRGLGCEITKDLICQSVGAYYRWCGKRTQDDFPSADAYRKYRDHFDSLLGQFRAEIERGGDLVLFGAAERAALVAQGRWIE